MPRQKIIDASGWVGLVLVGILLCVLLLASGCSILRLVGGGSGLSKTELKPAKTSITTEDRQPTVAHETRTIKHPDGSVETVMRTENTGPATSATATAEGAGISASGEKVDQGFDSSPPEISLPGGSTSGGAINGGTRAQTDLSKLVGKAAVNPLFWVGVVVLLVGIGCFVIPIPFKRPGMILVGSGAGLVAVSFLPAWAWWIIAAVFLACIGFYVWSELESRKKAVVGDKLRYALAGVTRAVEGAPAEVRSVIKARVDDVTDEDDKRVIREVKRGME